MTPETVLELRELPRHERREALEAIVAEQFRTKLLMEEGEEFPAEISFFDLGCTSLIIADVKEQLEMLLGCPISATVMFNQPTLEQFVNYLADDILRLSAT
ncbi:acyl carrier protein [Salinispora arenicola]|uniref:acyl carrier protein n=1 Tax=Salinispora arenicola TaxID=168697 RepID=UPI0016B664B6|nr:acyl carrier protein [Salinispora arenicola]NIL64993.1 acyl carrier protein [Salinispora arenicola]